MSGPAALLGLEGHPWAGAAVGADVLEELEAALRAPTCPDVTATPATAVPALLALVTDALARHARLDVPEQVTHATLLDVGRKVHAYGDSTDVGWLVGLLRADVLALGRLQLERVPGRAGRAVHVPEQGPLDPGRVDDALARAASTFGPGPLTCTSWLLDAALPAGLPPGSNIVRFAARFPVPPDTVGPRAAAEADGPTEGDHAVAKFVFRRPLEQVLDPAAVVPRTRLERLVTEHLRSGRHWGEPCGVLSPPPTRPCRGAAAGPRPPGTGSPPRPAAPVP